MKKLVLDTSILINYWRKRRGRFLTGRTAAEVEGWASELIARFQTDAIVTPVYIEMLAGVTNRQELELTRAFLQRFTRLDQGNILRSDWEDAIRLAQRVPRDRSPRNLGDCLIRAIANRLRHGVVSSDQRFPR